MAQLPAGVNLDGYLIPGSGGGGGVSKGSVMITGEGGTLAEFKPQTEENSGGQG